MGIRLAAAVGTTVLFGLVAAVQRMVGSPKPLVVGREDEDLFAVLVDAMERLACAAVGFLAEDAKGAEKEAIDRYAGDPPPGFASGSYRYPFAVRLAMHLKGTFGLLSNTQANRMVLRKAAIDYCTEHYVRKVHQATNVPLAVELALVPLSTDLLGRRIGATTGNAEVRRQMYAPIYRQVPSTTRIGRFLGLRTTVRAEEPAK